MSGDLENGELSIMKWLFLKRAFRPKKVEMESRGVFTCFID